MNVKEKVEPAMMQTASGSPRMEDIETEFRFESFETEVLRTLAKEVERLSGTEENKKKTEKWQNLNDLSSFEPVVFADPENEWNEIIHSIVRPGMTASIFNKNAKG